MSSRQRRPRSCSIAGVAVDHRPDLFGVGDVRRACGAGGRSRPAIASGRWFRRGWAMRGSHRRVRRDGRARPRRLTRSVHDAAPSDNRYLTRSYTWLSNRQYLVTITINSAERGLPESPSAACRRHFERSLRTSTTSSPTLVIRSAPHPWVRAAGRLTRRRHRLRAQTPARGQQQAAARPSRAWRPSGTFTASLTPKTSAQRSSSAPGWVTRCSPAPLRADPRRDCRAARRGPSWRHSSGAQQNRQ